MVEDFDRLAREIEERQLQMVDVKPIARWQLWLGKWLGIMTLNATLLLLSAGSVYGTLLWRAGQLPTEPVDQGCSAIQRSTSSASSCSCGRYSS